MLVFLWGLGLCLLRSRSAEHGGYPHEQLLGLEGLGHVVIASGFEADALVDDIAFRREEYNRGVAAGFSDLPTQGESVGLGQHHVEDDNIGTAALRH